MNRHRRGPAAGGSSNEPHSAPPTRQHPQESSKDGQSFSAPDPARDKPGCSEGLPHMARALVGYVGTNTDLILAAEVGRLRRRVAELEAELADLRATTHVDLDAELHELHRIAESA